MQADIDARLARLHKTLSEAGLGTRGVDALTALWKQAPRDGAPATARALLPQATALAAEVRTELDALQGQLEIGLKVLLGALALLLLALVQGLSRQRRQVKATLSQFSDDLGAGDWQEAVQTLRNERQGPPSAFDALATGVAGVLGESDRRWQALADLSADWYWETDVEHRLSRLFGSVAVFTSQGWQVDDVVGWRHDQIAFFRLQGKEGWQALHATFDGAQPFRDIEFEIISRDRRSLRWVAISGRPRQDLHGDFAGYEGVGRDITERKRAVARLQSSEQRWAAMTGLAADWYWETDDQHRIVPMAHESQGRAGEGVDRTEGRTRWEAHPKALGAEQWAEHRADLDARRPFRWLELAIDQGEQGVVWVSLSGVPRVDAGGRFRGYHGVGRDITVQKEAERVLLRHNEDLQHAVAERTRELQLINRDLEAFARQLAHELRTPIGQVQGLSQMLQDRVGERLTPEERNVLGMQLQAATAMRDTVEALLLMARSTMQTMAMERVDLTALVHEVIETLPETARDAPVRWAVQPGMQVMGCVAPLKIVLANLLGNAAKFTRHTPDPQVRVSATFDADGRVRVAVQDNGVGFPSEHASRLFTPFTRLHNSERYQGTGIGLTIVQRIVERHGGSVRAEGHRDAGARFEFTLAQAVATEPVAPAFPVSTASPAAAPLTTP